MARPRRRRRPAVPLGDRDLRRPRLRARPPGRPPLVGPRLTGRPDGVAPLTPQGLARRTADLALARVADAVAAGIGIRVGVDGAADEAGAVADSVATVLQEEGRPVARVRAGDFMSRRSVRMEYGAADVDNAYERWVDWSALRREVLDPLEDPAAMRWLRRLWDAAADRPFRDRPQPAPPGTIAVVDGPYLLRWELAGGFDAVVHLSLSDGALGRRFPGPEDPRPAAWRRYLAECDPASRADLVVRVDHPDRPALLSARRP